MDTLDLDTIIDRRGTGCLKYDFAVQRGKPADVLPFWVADMDFRVAEPITRALHARVDHGIFGYSEAGSSYFKALADWQKTYFHWTIHPEWLIKTPGVVPAINIAVKALTKPGDGVLLHQPVYYPFLSAIEKNGRRLVNSGLVLKEGHYEIDFDDMERKIEEGGVKIVADEIHQDFTYPGHTHTTFATISREAADNAIICTTPSKTFNIAGLQNSNIFIPNPEIRRAFQEELSMPSATTS